MRPVPEAVRRWISRLRYLRWLDGCVAWLGLWAASAWSFPALSLEQASVLSLVLLGVGSIAAPLRVRWRPVSGAVGFAVSRRLRPGDRAWYLRAGEADLVLVTARHGFRMVVAKPDLRAESISVRRTRILLLPTP